MTHYFYDLSLSILFLKLKGSQVYLFQSDATVSILTRVLGRIPLVKNIVNNLAQEPLIHIGSYKGLYYQINEEALECTDFVYHGLKLEDNQFTKIYNENFKTTKFKPFVLKWVSLYVFELLSCLYRVHLDKPSAKVLYLRNNPLNHYTYEWWTQQTGNEIPVKWLEESEVKAGLEAVASILALSIYSLLRGLCLPVRPKKFKIMREAVDGLRKPVLRDDFFVDDKKILKKDVLFYTYSSSHEDRVSAYKDAQESGYECIDRNKLKIPVNLLFKRLFKYHFRLPLVFVLSNFRNRQNYMLKEWLKWFHAPAISEEILLSHYQIGLDLSVNETSLIHIPQTIILNSYGAKSVIYHWSDLTCGNSVLHDFKCFNLYLTWGKAHTRDRQYFVDNIIETGCWLKHNFSEFTRNKRQICKKLGLPDGEYKVLAFYDESFNPNIHFTEEILLDFWQMMFELINKSANVIGIMKPKLRDMQKRRMLSDKGWQIYHNIKQRCTESGRLYVIDEPKEVGVTEVIAISDINITMGIGTPSTIALLCGKIGLYYDLAGNWFQPFTRTHKNKIVFDNKSGLFSAVNRIINEGYNPLNEIDEELLSDYDRFRDDRGLERFRDALLKNL